jgi:hypothetical protein
MLIIESGYGIERGEGESQKRMETCIQYSFAARLYGFQAEGSTRQLQGNRGELEFRSSSVPGGGHLDAYTKSHDVKSHDETFTSPPLMQRLGCLAGSNYRMGYGDFSGRLREV